MEVYCEGAGATAEYCTGAEECVVGSTTPVRRGGLSYRGEASGSRPWVETQVCKVTINCGYRCGRDRLSHLLKFRGRVISAIRYSVGARVYLPVLPSIIIRAPRMVAVRGPGDEWREGRVLLIAAEVNDARAGFCCRSGAVGAMKAAEVHGARAGFCCRSGAVGVMKAAEVHGARAEFCCRSRNMAPGRSLAAVAGTWREGRVLLP